MAPKSQCCDAEVIPGDEKSYWDTCSKCGIPMDYAVGEDYGGVVELYDGKLYFFHQRVSRWAIIEKNGLVPQYLGQVKRLVDTLGLRYRTQDVDMLPGSAYDHFKAEFIEKVANPHCGWHHTSF